MILNYGQVLLFLSSVTIATSVIDINDYREYKDGLDDVYSLWPSVHNAARLINMRKRDTGETVPKIESEMLKTPRDEVATNSVSQSETNIPKAGPSPVQVLGQSEGGVVEPKAPPVKQHPTVEVSTNNASNTASIEAPKGIINSTVHEDIAPPVVNEVKNNTAATTPANQLDLNKPGVFMRGLIVFGGFALMAVAYFIFYRRKNNKNDSGNSHSTNDANQFRYGVLQSDDRRDNLELSRMPLTMESDEDEDEDLEIFDLGQKKKSLSYVNLQTHDEDIVHDSRDNRDNLLLDIEDGPSDTLINWSNSNSNNKSIL